MFIVELRDQGVTAALNQLSSRVKNMTPVLTKIGLDITERAKRRFETSTGPDGKLWKENSPVTLARYMGKTTGNYLGSGKLSKKGATRLASKKPLYGHTGDLRRQIFPIVVGDTLIVGASPKYAAIQQFGGTKAEFKNLWGDIPARPFLPVRLDGSLYPQEQAAILDVLNRYLTGG